MPKNIVHIIVDTSEQTLEGFCDAGNAVYRASISTASNGVGQMMGSECTPLGEHRIRAKIGAGQPLNSVFIARRPTGEICSDALLKRFPTRDWILTRILWLCGNQSGFNRGGSVDTQRRYIYIHGAPDTHSMGVPSSHGCIKMRNNDIVRLFDRVEIGTKVSIQ
ncbi:L,D-transpeptidase [Arenicella xantha]|uniref:L,D-transpeptidase-like protein n=1 Tax=Arenicella xantha TaxID=644221 RepID=A0A395JJ65_9GAMM|nr:L,D-transpeptidase [Arenicella xantha]RBP50826.1 L,D-transpeptidase-like protein [Arenicella xantha]